MPRWSDVTEIGRKLTVKLNVVRDRSSISNIVESESIRRVLCKPGVWAARLSSIAFTRTELETAEESRSTLQDPRCTRFSFEAEKKRKKRKVESDDSRRTRLRLFSVAHFLSDHKRNHRIARPAPEFADARSTPPFASRGLWWLMAIRGQAVHNDVAGLFSLLVLPPLLSPAKRILT